MADREADLDRIDDQLTMIVNSGSSQVLAVLGLLDNFRNELRDVSAPALFSFYQGLLRQAINDCREEEDRDR